MNAYLTPPSYIDYRSLLCWFSVKLQGESSYVPYAHLMKVVLNVFQTPRASVAPYYTIMQSAIMCIGASTAKRLQSLVEHELLMPS